MGKTAQWGLGDGSCRMSRPVARKEERGGIADRGQTYGERGEAEGVCGGKELADVVMSFNAEVRSWQE